MKDGRPLRFLVGTLGGWTLIRIVQLWPGAATLPLGAVIHAMLPPVAADDLPVRAIPHVVRTARPVAPSIAPAVPSPFAAPPPLASDNAVHDRTVRAPTPPVAGIFGPPLRPPPIAQWPGRLAGSAWMLARGGPGGTLSGGQLGASQAGIRLTYALGHARRVAVAVRFATPLSGAGKEVALGFEWKPTRMPFRLIAEQRFVLDGGRGGPTVGIVGGYGPGLVAPGVRVEAYGQAGAIARGGIEGGGIEGGGIEGFVDAALRTTHPVIDHGPVRIDIGAGIWGSAQKGAARLDLGPTIGAVVPVAGHAIRLSADWRQRVAGTARPGSGPAFTIGSDF